MDKSRLMKTLEGHEGYRQFPYRCTADKLTIGIGRNLDDVGISYPEARHLLNNDIEKCRNDLANIFPDQFAVLPDHIQEVLMNMRFQLGPGGIRKFRKFIGAIRAWEMSRAYDEMLNSKWAKRDTPARAKELAGVLLNGFEKDR
jgi:lysozyme